MRQLMIMMLLIMFVTIPLSLIYASYSDLEEQPGYYFNRHSLGNMGGSDAICAKNSILDNRIITLSCSSGLISLDAVTKIDKEPIFDVGIIPKSINNNNHCANGVFDDPAKCSKYVDRHAMYSHINSECVGKSQCSIGHLTQYMKTDIPGFNEEECYRHESVMFIQVACLFEEQEVIDRQI